MWPKIYYVWPPTGHPKPEARRLTSYSITGPAWTRRTMIEKISWANSIQGKIIALSCKMMNIPNRLTQLFFDNMKKDGAAVISLWKTGSAIYYQLETVIIWSIYCSPTWKPPACSNPSCSGNGSADAMKICLDHSVSLSHHPDVPPPSFYCNDCYNALIRKSNSAKAHEMYEDIIHPIMEVDTTCENKNCRQVISW